MWYGVGVRICVVFNLHSVLECKPKETNKRSALSIDLSLSLCVCVCVCVCYIYHSVMTTSTKNLVQLKRSLRKQLRSTLSGIPLQDLQQEGHNLLQRFIATLSQQQQQPYTHICLYLPMKDAREINMVPLLRQSLDWGLRCYVPVVLSDSDDMEMVHVESWQDFERFEKIGKFEILEPPRDTLRERENCECCRCIVLCRI